jgi:hypothetical protein
MIQDRRFALTFRIGSFLFAALGLMIYLGVFEGKLELKALMYYTIQSNLVAILLFAVLAVKTAMGMCEGVRGNAGWYPRLGMICAVDLLVTLIVFWAMLVPQSTGQLTLWTFGNLAVHTVTPLLCLLDYVLFAPPQRLKYRDVYYVCIFPLCYGLFSIIAGLSGYIYGWADDALTGTLNVVPIRFPYFFLDLDRLGLMVFAYVGVIFVFFLLLSHAIYLIDHKLRRGKLPHSF